jgi:hypothetical protein
MKNNRVRHKLYQLLQPLKPTYSLSKPKAMDVITDLSLIEGYNQLQVIVDKFTNMAQFIPLKQMNTIDIDLTERFT